MSSIFGVELKTGEVASRSLWLGYFAQSASTIKQKLEVILPAYTDDLRFGPCVWPPRFEPIPQALLDAITTAATISTADEAPAALAQMAIAINNAFKWQQDPARFPKRFDPCIVSFDEHDNTLVLAWWRK